MERRQVRSGSPWEPVIGFSRAVRVGDTIHVSGTAPVEADGSCAEDPRAQAIRCLDIICDALHDAGASIEDVVRTRLYVTSAGVIDEVAAAHRAALGTVAPASTIVIVAGLADPRWVVEMEADAVVGARARG